MSVPDPLDRKLTRGLEDIAMTGAAWITELELAALVEIARAARDLDAAYQDGRDDLNAIYALRAALARLDNHASPHPR